MDLDTLKEMKLFQVELNRWKFFLRTEMEKTTLPLHMIAIMSVEDMIDYLLQDNREVTNT